MAVNRLNVKKIISRVRQVFPDAPETYIINLINECLVDLGKYQLRLSMQRQLQ